MLRHFRAALSVACSATSMLAELEPITFDLESLLHCALLLAVAFVLALPMGWDRERKARSAGLRTFSLVSLSSCAFLLVGQQVFDETGQARVLEGLVTGIGFVGGGAILKSGERVQGTATAAGIWTTGAIGAASAYGMLDIAVLLSVVTFATLRWLPAMVHNGDEASRDEGADRS